MRLRRVNLPTSTSGWMAQGPSCTPSAERARERSELATQQERNKIRPTDSRADDERSRACASPRLPATNFPLRPRTCLGGLYMRGSTCPQIAWPARSSWCGGTIPHGRSSRSWSRPAPARPRLRGHVLRPGAALDPARDQASLGAKAKPGVGSLRAGLAVLSLSVLSGRKQCLEGLCIVRGPLVHSLAFCNLAASVESLGPLENRY
jgi:hypothetical protein